MVPFLTLVGACRGVHGDAERAGPLLHPGAVAGDVQRRDDRAGRGARAARADARHRADRGRRGRHARRRPRAARDSVAAAGAGGLPLSALARLARSRARPRAAADGPGHDRHGRHADQRARQHAVRRRRGHRRDLVARLRLSRDVSADRTVRRVDRGRVDAGAVAAGRRSDTPRHARRRSARRSA